MPTNMNFSDNELRKWRHTSYQLLTRGNVRFQRRHQQQSDQLLKELSDELSLVLGVLIPTAELEKLKAIVSIAADISQKVAQSPQIKSLRSDISASFTPGARFRAHLMEVVDFNIGTGSLGPHLSSEELERQQAIVAVLISDPVMQINTSGE